MPGAIVPRPGQQRYTHPLRREVAGSAFGAALNPSLSVESQPVVLPGGTYAIPVIGILLGGAAAVIVLMLLREAGAAATWRAARAKLTGRIYDQDRELLELKTQLNAGVDGRIEDARQMLSERIDGLGHLIETRLPAATTRYETTKESPDQAMIHRETTVTRSG